VKLALLALVILEQREILELLVKQEQLVLQDLEKLEPQARLVQRE
jgi:hypothetical protein